MNFKIRAIGEDDCEINSLKLFLFNQIKKVYGIGRNPIFHYDIDDLKKYYILPPRNNCFAVYCRGEIVASIAIRAYDKDYDFFRDVYSAKDTASIWRLMVDENYRRHGLASMLVGVVEDFAGKAGYGKIYLNTHRYLDGALQFWQSLGYVITVEEDDYDQTTHMIKNLF